MRPADAMDAGRPFPLGATSTGDGVNFAVASEHATAIEVCLFDTDHRTELHRYTLPEHDDGVFHGHLAGAGPGLVYGLRAHGPYRPHEGLRFNPHKLLLDPYAREVVGSYAWLPEHFGYELGHPEGHRSFDLRDNARHALKARVAAPRPSVPDDERPYAPDAQTVVYEMHVKGYTRQHPDLPAALRGTYAGLAHPAAIAHLTSLGVTAVSLLPVQLRIDEAALAARGMSNYWGYNTLAYFVPDPRLASQPADPTAVADEFRAMVAALHAAGIEVLLDIVFNHTAEADARGPTLCFRGLDNPTWYRLQHDDRALYEDFTGCGNTLNIAHPRVTQFVLDVLRYWVEVMGVDGFRFDLAPALGRTAHGYDARCAFFVALRQDPVLARVRLIAEPWDLGYDGYQLGHFPGRFGEWNDKFRDAIRRYWMTPGSIGRGKLARRISGSSDVFHHAGRKPTASVNYIASHDGYTLADMVGYRHKHNEANGEHNRDGRDGEPSVNCGHEGPSQTPGVVALRGRLRRAMLATLFVAQGTPMLRAGDELGQTQGGNNNAYNQDNATSWIDWSHVDAALLDYTRALIALRRREPALRHPAWLHGGPTAHGTRDVIWLTPDGREFTIADWHDQGHHGLACLLAPAQARAIWFACNDAPHAVEFVLPPGDWTVLVESSAPFCAAGGPAGAPAPARPRGRIDVAAHALVILGSSEPSHA